MSGKSILLERSAASIRCGRGDRSQDVWGSNTKSRCWGFRWRAPDAGGGFDGNIANCPAICTGHLAAVREAIVAERSFWLSIRNADRRICSICSECFGQGGRRSQNWNEYSIEFWRKLIMQHE